MSLCGFLYFELEKWPRLTRPSSHNCTASERAPSSPAKVIRSMFPIGSSYWQDGSEHPQVTSMVLKGMAK